MINLLTAQMKIYQRNFEENSLLIRFYESFKSLDHLETLELLFSFNSDAEAYKYQSYLSQSILKRISSSLKTLRILPSAYNWGLTKKSVAEIQDFYLPQILESCESFATTLETLEIGKPKMKFCKFDLSNVRSKFINLSKIEINAKFQDSNIENIGDFLQNIILLGESITLIKIDVMINQTATSLLSLLRQMNHLKRSNKLVIKLLVDFLTAKNVEDSGISFANGVYELKSDQGNYSKVQGVFLQLEPRNYSDDEKEFLRVYYEKFEKEIIKPFFL